jgi:deoxyribonuclease V
MLFAAVVVLHAETFETIETVGIRDPARFPYVPGYLSFREAPALLRAFAELRQTPDLLICDGHGVAHPRRFGLASHLGLWLDLPTIGCAKSRLIGSHAEPGARRGSRRRLIDAGEIVGEVVRTRDSVRPVYVSIGHRISLPTARRWVLRLARRFRLSEPVRAAHLEVNRLRS